MFFVRGVSLRNPADQSLPRNTTKLNEIHKVTFWQYVRGLSWWLVFRTYALASLRKTAVGEAAIHSLKKVLGRT